MIKIFSSTLLFVYLTMGTSFAQSRANSHRISTHNNLVWINNFVTASLTSKLSMTGEYQFRRTNFIENWQQSLLRFTTQYRIEKNTQLGMGYGWIESFPYGEFANMNAKPTVEHRMFQQVSKDDKINRVGINHRLRLEQRFLGQNDPLITASDKRKISSWKFAHRARYQLRFNVPIVNTTITDKSLYAAMYNEVFIGFGKNVARNVLDQNRTGLLLGYKFNKHVALEAGYFLFILQQANQLNNLDVYQYNNGILLQLNTLLF